MKSLFLALGLSLLSFTAFADDAIFEKQYPDSEEATVKQRILETYSAAISDAGPNALKDALVQLKNDLEEPELGTVGDPTESDMFLLSSGRGGPGIYGGSYLLGVPVSLNGTGLIEEYGFYLRVNYELKFDEYVRISIERIVELK